MISSFVCPLHWHIYKLIYFFWILPIITNGFFKSDFTMKQRSISSVVWGWSAWKSPKVYAVDQMCTLFYWLWCLFKFFVISFSLIHNTSKQCIHGWWTFSRITQAHVAVFRQDDHTSIACIWLKEILLAWWKYNPWRKTNKWSRYKRQQLGILFWSLNVGIVNWQNRNDFLSFTSYKQKYSCPKVKYS